jgi:murein DD-endopeptidase MepM/ murein hydrolase activator NlpD
VTWPGVFFFPPLRGIVTSTFDRAQGHFGIDIVAKADAAVKACLSGTVTLASWTTDAGHVLHIQHAERPGERLQAQQCAC